jgi:predicted aspartyl protease
MEHALQSSASVRLGGAALLVAAALVLAPRPAPGTVQAVPPLGSAAAQTQAATTDAVDQLAEVMVEAREPRYVAPTRRDRIGRIWAPVLINGRGPFRLVLDTGASSSAVTAMVALALDMPTDRSPPVLLRGVTGEATVPTIKVDTLSVGDLAVDSALLPIVPDALGGAEGVLGSEGLKNKRIFIDFRHDQIAITYSRDERAERGFATVPFKLIRGQLIVIDALVGAVHAKAIIDTGGQATIGNLALRDALLSRNRVYRARPDSIQGATLAIESGELIDTPPIAMGPIQIRDYAVTFANVYIFKHWKVTDQPAIMIGMDALGTLDALVIDYRRKELQIRLATPS